MILKRHHLMTKSSMSLERNLEKILYDKVFEIKYALYFVLILFIFLYKIACDFLDLFCIKVPYCKIYKSGSDST